MGDLSTALAFFPLLKYNIRVMSAKLRVKGKLRTYLQTPMLLGGILVLVNIWIYLVSVEAGLILTAFVVIYLIIIGYLIPREGMRSFRTPSRGNPF